MNYRPQRVSNLIREELSKLIAREVEFEPGVLVTITEVEIAKKLERAKVRASVLPSAAADDVLKVLQRSAGRLQHILLRKINIKPMPRIEFEIDHGLEDAAVVEKRLLENH